MTRPRPARDRRGFALALVVLMLFAIGVAATAAYEVVNTEFTLSTSNREAIQALSVARGGLQRFIGEQIGVVGDSVSYAIGDGVATVTSRKLFEEDSVTYLYFIRSEGTFTDPREPDSPARRVVGTYAWYHRKPVKHRAAIMAASSYLRFYTYAYVNGYDQATAYDCSGGGTAGVAGAIGYYYYPTAYYPYAVLYGNPSSARYSSLQAVVDSSGIRWDVLSNPNFPVEFDNAPPDWSTIPSDSFPVVRKVGDLNATDSGNPANNWSGRGVLIVTGTLNMRGTFYWKGIILAGNLGSVDSYQIPTIQGTIIGNLNGVDNSIVIQRGSYRYNSCYVYAANASLSYLDVVDKTVFEINN